jgi:hypothetical protein
VKVGDTKQVTTELVWVLDLEFFYKKGHKFEAFKNKVIGKIFRCKKYEGNN